MTFSVKPHDFYNATYGETDSLLAVVIDKLTNAVDKELVSLLDTARQKKYQVRDTWFNTSAAVQNVTTELVSIATATVVKKLCAAGFNAHHRTMGSDDSEEAIWIVFPTKEK